MQGSNLRLISDEYLQKREFSLTVFICRMWVVLGDRFHVRQPIKENTSELN